MTARQRIRVTQSQRLGLNLGLNTSIRLLKADALGLTRYLEEQAAENPHLLLSPPPMGDWLPRWETAFAGGGLDPDLAASAGPSLIAHVGQAVALMGLDGAEARVALALVEALEPSGWLGRPTAWIAHEAGVTEALVLDVLARLQKIEPAGLFARSLAECLLLQAAEAGLDDAVLRGVLTHLPLMAAGEAGRIAALLGVTEAEVLARFRLIRRLDPKPGAQFAATGPLPREPDLVARREGAGWRVALNGGALPSVAVSAGRGEGRGAARALLRLIESRNATLLRVGAEVLRRQEAVLERGMVALSPLTMGEVAAVLGLHQSTVSRVVAGTAVDTPRGTLWLRALFSGTIRGPAQAAAFGADGAAGGGAAPAFAPADDRAGPPPAKETRLPPASGAVRARLAALIAAEAEGAPLDDAALVAALAAEGLPIARRTVVKYRAALGIPPAHRRRRRG